MKKPIVVVSICLVLLSSCSQNNDETSSSSAQSGEQERSAKQVNVITVKSQRISLTQKIPGRVRASLVAEIRPQVSGIVQSRLFDEGSFVEKGEQLYQIDPAIYESAYQSAQANLENAKAEFVVANALQKRYQSLLKTNAISEQEFDNSKADLAQANAAISLAEAEVQAAKINLDYTKVKAPISGYIGPSAITIGALVSARQSSALATIRQLDPIFVDISQSGTDSQDLQQRLIASQSSADKERKFGVTLTLGDDDESEYSDKGTLYATDLTVDENTGAILLRAVFPNPDATLLPGMFVRATVDDISKSEIIMVPQKAVNIEANGSKTVWTVNEKNIANKREVITNGTFDNNWIISDGLSEGDVVILEGTMMLRAGTPVEPNNQTKVEK